MSVSGGKGMPGVRSLRSQIAEILGANNSSPEAKAIYMLADKVEVLEKNNAELRAQYNALDGRTGGLKTYGGPKR